MWFTGNGWFKQVIGDRLRLRTDDCLATTMEGAVYALNRMLEMGHPNYVCELVR